MKLKRDNISFLKKISTPFPAKKQKRAKDISELLKKGYQSNWSDWSDRSNRSDKTVMPRLSRTATQPQRIFFKSIRQETSWHS